MMKTCIFTIFMLSWFLGHFHMKPLILIKFVGVNFASENRVTFSEKDTDNLVGTYEDFNCRLELDTIGDENTFKFFIKRRSAWDGKKLKFDGSGNWEAVGNSLELRFDSKKRNSMNKFFIEVFTNQIYLVKIEEHNNFSELTSIRKYADEELNMLYVKELLNNRFLVKLE
jgi:hypothetical protein